jgi:hypothetical protein
MFIVLNGEGLEPALPDVTIGAVSAVVSANVCGEQPLHPPAEVSVVPRPQDQVEMIRHEAEADDADG